MKKQHIILGAKVLLSGMGNSSVRLPVVALLSLDCGAPIDQRQ